MMDAEIHAKDDALTAGTLIAGKYRVERELGRGGMGVVVAATHVDLDQHVAIKILQKSAALSPDALARFSREAKAAAKIRSEHVTRVMDVGKLEDGLTYIVMEYLEGSDLAEMLRQEGQLRISDAAEYILQACEGIAAAHAAGIVHRDIKPANLFVARQRGRADKIKILDFGVSKISDGAAGEKQASTTQTGQVFGSPMYMSPEQLEAAITVDGRTDIWALGVVLFELLAGKPPFQGKSSANIMSSVLRDPAPKLRSIRPDVPAALEEVVARCLEKDREFRYATVIDLAESIAPFCGKGAEDAVNRIYQILAHAADDDLNAVSSAGRSVTEGAAQKGSSSGNLSDRRGSGPPTDSGPASLKGAAHTRENALTHAKQRAAMIVFVAVAALATIGITVLGRTSRSNASISTAEHATSASASLPAPVLEPTPSQAPAQAATNESDTSHVTITFTGAPEGTKVFRGNAEIGSANTPLRLPRQNAKVTLRFTAESYESSEIELTSDVDQTVTVSLKSAKATTTAPVKRKVPKELEPF